MALLYERSRVWRTIVHATKDPRVLALFFTSSIGGAALLAWGSQTATDSVAKKAREDLEDRQKRDYETARYSKHSKEALGQMFEHVRGDQAAPTGVSTGSTETEKPRIKLPGVAWHPKAVERDQRAAAKKAATAAATQPSASSSSNPGHKST